jgi:hypothetical protein
MKSGHVAVARVFAALLAIMLGVLSGRTSHATISAALTG